MQGRLFNQVCNVIFSGFGIGKLFVLDGFNAVSTTETVTPRKLMLRNVFVHSYVVAFIQGIELFLDFPLLVIKKFIMLRSRIISKRVLITIDYPSQLQGANTAVKIIEPYLSLGIGKHQLVVLIDILKQCSVLSF